MSWQRLPEMILALGQRKHSWNFSADAVGTWSASQLHTMPICGASSPFGNNSAVLETRPLRGGAGAPLAVCGGAVLGQEQE